MRWWIQAKEFCLISAVEADCSRSNRAFSSARSRFQFTQHVLDANAGDGRWMRVFDASVGCERWMWVLGRQNCAHARLEKAAMRSAMSTTSAAIDASRRTDVPWDCLMKAAACGIASHRDMFRERDGSSFAGGLGSVEKIQH